MSDSLKKKKLIMEEINVTNATNGESHIEKLCTELLLKIFSYLDVSERIKLEQVCKRWRDISRGGWPDIKEISWSYGKGFDKLILLRRAGPYLNRLEICDTCRLPLPSDFEKLLKTYQNLQKFTYIALISNSPFKSNSVWKSRYGLADAIDALPKNSLTELEIEGDRSPIFFNVAKLRSLQCLWLWNVTLNEGTLQGLKRLKNLRTLRLWRNNIHETYFEEIPFLKNLEILDINFGPMNDEHLINIIDNCTNLRILRLRDLKDLTFRCYKKLSELTNLETLEIEGNTFTKDNIKEVSNLRLTNLRYS